MPNSDSRDRLTSAEQLAAAGLDGLGGSLGPIVLAWPSLVGERLARVSMPTSLRGGTLRVRCSSASWAQAIAGMELELVHRFDERLGHGVVRRVHARAGSLAPASPPSDPTPAPAPPQLGARDLARLRGLVEHIADPRLREQLYAAAVATERRRRAQARKP